MHEIPISFLLREYSLFYEFISVTNVGEKQLQLREINFDEDGGQQ